MRKQFIAMSRCPGECGATVHHIMGEDPPPCDDCRDKRAWDEAQARVYHEAMERANAHQLAQEQGRYRNTDNDPGAHYRWEIRRRITDEDIARGWVRVKLDPYRICRVAGVGGGPHEHATKKLLRGEAKGHEARALIREARACLDRWEEMIAEDEEEARCR